MGGKGVEYGGWAHTEAICPLCRQTHKCKVFWVGRGKPRIYCPPCKARVGSLSDDAPHIVPDKMNKRR